jgi:glycosyltransferase involved in cell wall biosynthesis
MKIAVAGPVDLSLIAPLLDTPAPGPGYSFPMTSYLVRELVAQDHKVSVVACDPATSAPYRLTGPRIDVRVVPMRARARDRALDFFRLERQAIERELRDLAPDVIHAHWTYEFAMAALRTGAPTLVTVHDWAPAVLAQHRDTYRAIRLAMQVRVLTRARHLTAVSPYISGKVARLARTAVELVPNGLPDAYYREPAVAEDQTAITYGCLVNGDDRRKNLRLLLRAFGSLRSRVGASAGLEVAGRGCAEGDPLHAWASASDLTAGVTFRGPMSPDAVPAYLAGLHVFVHPSLEESFGMALLEAMATALPVVAGAKSGAVPWLLSDGRAGMLTDVSDVAALTDAMESLMEAEKRQGFASAARARADDFRMSRVARQYAGLYEQTGR